MSERELLNDPDFKEAQAERRRARIALNIAEAALAQATAAETRARMNFFKGKNDDAA
jgi:hypothetical protein